MSDYDMFSSLLGLSLGLILFVSIIVLAIIVLYVIGTWKLFKKAGKQGWEALIPFYSTYVLVEISGLNWWYFLIAISGTIVNILDIDGLSTVTLLASRIVNAFCFYNIAKKTKQNQTGYAIAAAFVPGIMALIVGLSKSITWDNTISVSPNGPIDANNKDSNVPQEKYCLGCGHKLDNGVQFCKNCRKKVE